MSETLYDRLVSQLERKPADTDEREQEVQALRADVVVAKHKITLLQAQAARREDELATMRARALDLENELAGLQVAFKTRAVIDQAKGILMAERRCTADEAFAILTQASQRSNTKLHTLAERIVACYSPEPPPTPDMMRR